MQTNRGFSRLERWLASALVAGLSILSLPPTGAYGQPLNAAEAREAAPVDLATRATVDPAQLRELQATADGLRGWLAANRGIALEEPVTLAVRSKEELRAHLIATVEREVSPQYLAAHQRLTEILGLLEPGQNYLELLLGLLEDQVAGYYDHEEKIFYLLDTDVQNFDAMVIVHELQHAAQDRRWNLGEWMRPDWKISDVSTARSALIEGDATLTMFAYGLSSDLSSMTVETLESAASLMRSNARAGSASLPQFLLDGLVGSYARGLVFAGTLYGQERWASIDAAFDARPMSSEQIAYPARYLAGDEPTFLRFETHPTLAGTRAMADIVGLLNARDTFNDLLASVATEHDVDAATSDWDGDRLELWQSTDADTAHWLWVLDSSDGADRLFQLVERALPVWTGASSESMVCADGAHGGRCGIVHRQRGAMVERWGDMVQIVIRHEHAAPVTASTLIALADTVWSSVQRSRYPDALR